MIMDCPSGHLYPRSYAAALPIAPTHTSSSSSSLATSARSIPSPGRVATYRSSTLGRGTVPPRQAALPPPRQILCLWLLHYVRTAY